MNANLFIVVLLTALMVGCGKKDPISDAYGTKLMEMRKALKSVIIADGISSAEAKIIADCYFEMISSCGGVRAIEDAGEFWRVKAVIGYGGTPVKHFQILKATGAVTSSIGPTCDNPLDICDHPLDFFR